VLTREPGKGTYADIVNNLTDFVTIDMLCHALGADAGKAPAGMQTEVRTWMNSAGWKYKKVQLNGVRRAGWVRPKCWPFPESDETQATPDAASASALPITGSFTDDAPF
jgi:hypothetical protein